MSVPSHSNIFKAPTTLNIVCVVFVSCVVCVDVMCAWGRCVVTSSLHYPAAVCTSEWLVVIHYTTSVFSGPTSSDAHTPISIDSPHRLSHSSSRQRCSTSSELTSTQLPVHSLLAQVYMCCIVLQCSLCVFMCPMKMCVHFGTVQWFISWWTLLIMQYSRKWRLDYRRRYIEAGLGGST